MTLYAKPLKGHKSLLCFHFTMKLSGSQAYITKNTLPKAANLPRRGCSTDQSLSDFIKIIFTFIILLVILLIFLSIITSGLRTIDLIQRNS